MKLNNDRTVVRSVARTLAILECFDAQKPVLSLQEIIAHLKLPKTTVFRLVHTLVRTNYLIQLEDQKFCLSMRLLKLGNAVHERVSIRDVARPEMLDVSQRTNETVEMSMLTAINERICIEVVESKSSLKSIVRIGEAIPLVQGATGKTFLAHMPAADLEQFFKMMSYSAHERRQLEKQLLQIRQNGWAQTDGERVRGASAIAAPIFDSQGRNLYCMTLVGPTVRIKGQRNELRKLLLAASRRVCDRLGGSVANRDKHSD